MAARVHGGEKPRPFTPGKMKGLHEPGNIRHLPEKNRGGRVYFPARQEQRSGLPVPGLLRERDAFEGGRNSKRLPATNRKC